MNAAERFATFADRHRCEIAPGCSSVAHRKIGFCGSCQTVRWTEESLGWRLLASAQDEAADIVA